MTLGDRIYALLVEMGPLPLCTIATTLRKRKADVLAVLRDDPRFVRTGSTKASRWSVVETEATAGTFTASELERRWVESLGCDSAMARAFVHDFLTAGLLERVTGNGRLVVSELGLRYARVLEGAGA